jgi:hypothetical protein
VKGGRAAMIGLACAAPLVSHAATLPIDGTYGNPAGCTLARTGNYGEDDSARILKPDSLETMVTGCSFTTVTPMPGGRHHVAMTCASEGSGPEDNYEDKAEISGDAASGYVVHFADGTDWEALKKC